MLPRSLLFSSDEGTARSLGQALRELELDVEHCPEIFAAVEKLTSRSFDVVVVDWDDGVEAVFFLKTARELKTSSSAFVVAIAATGAHQAAMRVGADLVLAKPILPEQAKRELFTCDEFLRHMRKWLAAQLAEDQGNDEQAAGAITAPPPSPEKSRPAPVAIWPTARPTTAPPPKTTSAALPSYLPRISSELQTLFNSAPQKPAPAKPADPVNSAQRRTNILRRSAFAVAFLTAGYISVEPLPSQAVVHSVANFYDMAVTKAHAILHPSVEDDGSTDDNTIAQNIAPPRRRPVRRVETEIGVPPSAPTLEEQAALEAQINAAQIDAQPAQPLMQSAISRIPDSLRMPFQNAGLRNAAARISPSLLGALQPVIVPEDLSEKLLLERVQPSYPQQALQAGLEGPVVLQAFIGTDGRIQDLKLVQGYFVLGQAACRAVRQWRYKPYFLNGQAVAAQTYVTIDFKLPASPNGS